MSYLTDAKASAGRAHISAENAYRQALDAHRAEHSAAVAGLIDREFTDAADVLAWMRDQTSGTSQALAEADASLKLARVELLAIEDAELAEHQAAQAKANAVRYADRLDEIAASAEEAMAVATVALMKATGSKEIRL